MAKIFEASEAHYSEAALAQHDSPRCGITGMLPAEDPFKALPAWSLARGQAQRSAVRQRSLYTVWGVGREEKNDGDDHPKSSSKGSSLAEN